MKVWVPKKVSQGKEVGIQPEEGNHRQSTEQVIDTVEPEQQEVEGVWTLVTRGNRKKGLPPILDDSLKHIFSQNGFSSLVIGMALR